MGFATECATDFPDTLKPLMAWDVVVLSDFGANTLLLPPAVWLHGRPSPNRERPLGDYAAAGGGLAMSGCSSRDRREPGGRALRVRREIVLQFFATRRL